MLRWSINNLTHNSCSEDSGLLHGWSVSAAQASAVGETNRREWVVRHRCDADSRRSRNGLAAVAEVMRRATVAYSPSTHPRRRDASRRAWIRHASLPSLPDECHPHRGRTSSRGASVLHPDCDHRPTGFDQLGLDRAKRSYVAAASRTTEGSKYNVAS
jgi:hypothetical protein